MFQKFVKSVAAGAPAPGSVLTVIASDVRIVGDIFTQGEIQVDGQVEGDIACATLVVGEGARISGEVTAETVRVHGGLTGKIAARQVGVARTARVVGDILHQSLEIEAGAHVEGRLVHREPDSPGEVRQIQPPSRADSPDEDPEEV